MPDGNRPLRLCYIADLQSIHTQRWVSYFAERGHSVTVLSPTRKDLPGVATRSIFWRPGLPKILQLANIMPIASTLRTLKPDVLHAHYVRVYGWLAALSYFNPLVITVWGGDILADQGAFSDFFARRLTPFALKRATVVTAHSRFLSNRVIDLGKPEGQVRIIGCPGVDRRQFKPGLNTDALRDELEGELARVANSSHAATPQTSQFVLCTRLIDRLYNTETIIKAIPRVLEQVAAAKFIFSEYASERNYGREMKALVKTLRVEGSVIFLETIPHDRMSLFLNLARVFVSVPDSDGMPQSLLEAMSCGTVPIVSKLRQYDEVIKNEVNALVVPARNSEVLAAAVVRLLKDDALRQRLSRACVDTVVEGMDYETEMAKMEKLYYELRISK